MDCIWLKISPSFDDQEYFMGISKIDGSDNLV